MASYEVRNRRGDVIGKADTLPAARVIAKHHHAKTSEHYDIFEIEQVWSTEPIAETFGRRYDERRATSPEGVAAAADIVARYRDPNDTLSLEAAVMKLRVWGFSDRQADAMLQPPGVQRVALPPEAA